jgi:phosphoribosylglycinamide formyltransferase 1
MIKVAIFASGSGSNAEQILQYFSNQPEVEISLILTNNHQAGVIERARRYNVPTVVFTKKNFQDPEGITLILKNQQIDWLVLAGFLLLVPKHLVDVFPEKIINIHPALLPKYGGKGMWGHHVHEAVVANGETETGITIHYVNEKYDEGKVIFQATCQVMPTDTPELVAQKIHELEHAYFPKILEKEILGLSI